MSENQMKSKAVWPLLQVIVLAVLLIAGIVWITDAIYADDSAGFVDEGASSEAFPPLE